MWARNKRQPPPIEGAIIYPLLYIDQTVPDQMLSITLRFDDVLDAERLRAALSRLFEMGDWRKMGGRLRRNVSGDMEIHAPPVFTPEHPAIDFSHEVYPIKMEEHGLGRKMPQAGSEPFVHSGASIFSEFSGRPGAADSWEQLISTGQPIIGLRVSSFEDRTLVALAWPHILFDAMGLQVLLRAWSCVLAGREDDVPALLGARDDVLYKAADPKADKGETLSYVESVLAGWRMVVFVLLFLWSMLTERQPMRAIFLSKKAMSHLRREAEDDLKSPGVVAPFLSDNDILMAWYTRMIAACSRARPATLLTVVNVKNRIPSVIRPGTAGEYVQNTVSTASCFLSRDEVRGPLGRIALRHREELDRQATESEIIAHFRHARQRRESGRDGAFVRIGDASGRLIVCSNWSKSDLWNTVDFSPAVIKSCHTGSPGVYPPGSLVYHHVQFLKHDPMARNVFLIHGKDAEGNYWMSGFVADSVWKLAERELRRLTDEVEKTV